MGSANRRCRGAHWVDEGLPHTDELTGTAPWKLCTCWTRNALRPSPLPALLEYNPPVCHSFFPPSCGPPRAAEKPTQPPRGRANESAVGLGQFPDRVASLLLTYVGLGWSLGLVLVAVPVNTTSPIVSFRQVNGANFARWALPAERVPPLEPHGHAVNDGDLGRSNRS